MIGAVEHTQPESRACQDCAYGVWKRSRRSRKNQLACSNPQFLGYHPHYGHYPQWVTNIRPRDPQPDPQTGEIPGLCHGDHFVPKPSQVSFDRPRPEETPSTSSRPAVWQPLSRTGYYAFRVVVVLLGTSLRLVMRTLRV